MSIESDTPTDADARAAIRRLIQDWGLWRDTGRWTELRAAYAPGATMTTTWLDGPASDFVDASIRMSSGPALVQHSSGRRHPAGFRHPAHLQASAGAVITAGIPAHNSEGQAQLYQQAQRWLTESV